MAIFSANGSTSASAAASRTIVLDMDSNGSLTYAAHEGSDYHATPGSAAPVITPLVYPTSSVMWCALR